MNFIVDAHIPKKISQLLQDAGHNSIHTSSLPLRNETPDNLINKISIEENRIVITKDSDFYNSFILRQVPYKIIFVKTGNISKLELIKLFEKNLDTIQENSIIELDSSQIRISHL
jgi:predicted nuclease of predicted toxin-antitoxin system